MPTVNESIASLEKKAATKRRYLTRLNKTLANTQANIKKTNEELAVIDKKLNDYENRRVLNSIQQRGIKLSDVAAAIEAGLFDEYAAPQKPPDTSKKDKAKEPEMADDVGATYSTEENPAESGEDNTEKEDLTDDIGDS